MPVVSEAVDQPNQWTIKCSQLLLDHISIISREKRSTLADIVEQLQEREAAVVSALATEPFR